MTYFRGKLDVFVVISALILGVSQAHPDELAAYRDEVSPSALWQAPIELRLPRLSGRDARDVHRLGEGASWMRLEPQAPEGLILRYSPSPSLTFYVTAELDKELPKLDAVDGETYYTVGLEFQFAQGASVFVEDFQPASMTLGRSPHEPAPQRSWDGHQTSLGLRLDPTQSLGLELRGVLYSLSLSQRATELGASAFLSFRF